MALARPEKANASFERSFAAIWLAGLYEKPSVRSCEVPANASSSSSSRETSS